jgi:hypothetical protein
MVLMMMDAVMGMLRVYYSRQIYSVKTRVKFVKHNIPYIQYSTPYSPKLAMTSLYPLLLSQVDPTSPYPQTASPSPTPDRHHPIATLSH